MSQSKIYIFDEPTASLDKLNASLLITVGKLCIVKSVIVVSHDPRLISSSTNMLNLN